jgi:hypothetical protein
MIRHLPRFVLELVIVMTDDQERRERFLAELERRYG